jgi:hypothetical protein
MGFHLTRSCAKHYYSPSGGVGQGVSVLRTAVFLLAKLASIRRNREKILSA